MSSQMSAATAISDDELFNVEYWRDEFKRLLSPFGRQWKKKIKEVDSNIDCNTLESVRDNRASLEKTRRVVKILQNLETQSQQKESRISSKLKRHKLTVR